MHLLLSSNLCRNAIAPGNREECNLDNRRKLGEPLHWGKRVGAIVTQSEAKPQHGYGRCRGIGGRRVGMCWIRLNLDWVWHSVRDLRITNMQ